MRLPPHEQPTNMSFRINPPKKIKKKSPDNLALLHANHTPTSSRRRRRRREV